MFLLLFMKNNIFVILVYRVGEIDCYIIESVDFIRRDGLDIIR